MKEVVLHLDVKSRSHSSIPCSISFLFESFKIHIVDDSLSLSNPLFTSGLSPPASYLPLHPSSILCIDSLYSLSVY